MRSSQSAPLWTAAPSWLDSSGRTGSLTVTVAAASRSASTAGAMCRVWNAPATWSGRSRALAGGSAANAASCSSVPAATTCPAPLMFAGVSPCASMESRTVASSPPSTAVIPVASMAAAFAMACPRTRTRRIASSAVSTPAMTPAPSSPTLCPAVAPVCTWAWSSPPNRASAAAMAAATSSGWATAVSRISSASAVVPYLIRSTPASSDQAPTRSAKPGSSSQGDRKPGLWAP